jgi:glycosyltransferase involved in cell wall biosynthesis
VSYSKVTVTRVCFISFEYPPEVLGGLGVYADLLIKGFNERGIDVLTITRGDRDEYGEKIIRILTPNILYWRRFFFISKAINVFRHLNKLWKFDLVHLNGAYPIMRSLGLPTVCTFHSTNFVQLISGFQSFGSIKTLEDMSFLLLKNPAGILADILSARLSDRIICPSPSIAQELQSYCFVREEKIRVIPNGIELKTLNDIKTVDTSLLENNGIEKDKYVLFVGRLALVKGVDSLIDAFRLFHEEYADVKLVIVGDGPSMPYLKSISLDLDGVLFLGRITSPKVKRLLYENCFVVVVPSIHDTLPTVVLEAMMNRKPVIATNVGGNPFMVRNGENGFLVPPKDSRRLSQSIKALYQNPDLRKRMGARGRKTVKIKFSSENMITKTLRVYETLVS